MTQDEIIEMGKQAGLTSKLFIAVQAKYTVLDPNIEAFAKLVAAKYEDEIQDLKDMIMELMERQE